MTGFSAGETWTTRRPAATATSLPQDGAPPYLVIGAILHADTTATGIAACAVWNARAKSAEGAWAPSIVPFLPLSLAALARTVVERAEPLALPDGFLAHFEAWRADPKGLTVYTIPFEGSLDTLIAHQMAAIIGMQP